MQAESRVAQSSRAGNQAQMQDTRAVASVRSEADLRLLSCYCRRRGIVARFSREIEAARFSFQLIATRRLKSAQPQRISCCNSSQLLGGQYDDWEVSSWGCGPSGHLDQLMRWQLLKYMRVSCRTRLTLSMRAHRYFLFLPLWWRDVYPTSFKKVRSSILDNDATDSKLTSCCLKWWWLRLSSGYASSLIEVATRCGVWRDAVTR